MLVLNSIYEKRFYYYIIYIYIQCPVFFFFQSFEPNDSRLKSSECLKNAAGLAVDSASAVLSQTVYAVIDIEKKYMEVIL